MEEQDKQEPQEHQGQAPNPAEGKETGTQKEEEKQEDPADKAALADRRHYSLLLY